MIKSNESTMKKDIQKMVYDDFSHGSHRSYFSKIIKREKDILNQIIFRLMNIIHIKLKIYNNINYLFLLIGQNNHSDIFPDWYLYRHSKRCSYFIKFRGDELILKKSKKIKKNVDNLIK